MSVAQHGYRRPALPILALLMFAVTAAYQRTSAQTLFAVVLATPAKVVGSSTLPSGIFRSQDTGRTWLQLGPRNVKGFSMDAVDSARGRILFMAAGNGVHRSTDFGRSWRIVTDWRITEVLDVHVDQRDPRRVYAASAFGLWCSSDGGNRWSQPAGPLQTLYTYSLADACGMLMAATNRGLFGSADHGVTWVPIVTSEDVRTATELPGSTFHTMAMAARDRLGVLAISAPRPDSPLARPAVVRFGGGNAGQQIYAVVPIDSATAFVAGDAGIVRAQIAPGLTPLENLTGALPNSVVHALVDADGTLIAGTYGNGLFRYERGAWVASGLDGAVVWSLHRRNW